MGVESDVLDPALLELPEEELSVLPAPQPANADESVTVAKIRPKNFFVLSLMLKDSFIYLQMP